MTQFKDKAHFDFDYVDVLLNDLECKKEAMEKTNAKTIVDNLEFILETFKKQKELFNKVGVGLYDYPVLMAADILLYNTDAVPVGEDQVQHVELTRDLAKRFNQQFGLTFKIPEVIIRKEGARIMGLDDPLVKMSKSATSELNYIALLDKPEVAAKKIMKAVTDSGKEIKYDLKNKPAIANLLTIYSILGNTTIKELEKKYSCGGPAFAEASAGKYGEFKKDLAEVVKEFLVGFQKKYDDISDAEIKKILSDGAGRARPLAETTLQKVKTKIGVL
jgi:tryptophanyl-tRNA synthetase